MTGLYLCWTRKEAYLKALGEGLSRPLESFDVSLAPGEPARLLRDTRYPAHPSQWSWVTLEPRTGFVAALTVPGSDPRVQCWEYDPAPCIIAAEAAR